jgi:hypothetical protein
MFCLNAIDSEGTISLPDVPMDLPGCTPLASAGHAPAIPLGLAVLNLVLFALAHTDWAALAAALDPPPALELVGVDGGAGLPELAGCGA